MGDEGDEGDKGDKENNPCPILLYERLHQRQRSVQVPNAQCPTLLYERLH
ncbi:MAG: histidine kinase [Nostoc sp. NMS7]|nr:histidine kinase [Nostoc sp. NMS7]MBN3947728.1 histidine kinase [Nostoc sp. NMS7]